VSAIVAAAESGTGQVSVEDDVFLKNIPCATKARVPESTVPAGAVLPSTPVFLSTAVVAFVTELVV